MLPVFPLQKQRHDAFVLSFTGTVHTYTIFKTFPKTATETYFKCFDKED